jgi:LysR family glycine cleavage system transcriptional activator
MVRRYYNLPSLTSLAAFEASARHLSFKDAARELNVTPGAVSRQIKLLEEEAGTLLFKRVHRGVQLAAAGEDLRAVLSQSFTRSAQVFEAIRNQNRAPAVTVGATTAFASMWLMPRLGSFWRAHEEITVNHQISDTAEDLRHPGIDLRIRYGGGRWSGESVEKLFGDVIYPVSGPDFALRHGDADRDGFDGLPLLRLHGVDPEWLDWDEWLARAGLAAAAGGSHRFNNYIITLQAARDNQGVALGWHSLVKPLVDSGKLVRFTDVQIDAPGAFYATWDANRPLGAAAVTLRDWLVGQAATG